MNAKAKRFLMRAAGFAAGAAVAGFFTQPWNQLARAYQVEGLLWMVIGGALGLMVVEPWRRSMPDQDALDRAEEATLDEATIRSLGRYRLWALATFTILALAWMASGLGAAYWSHSPGFAAVMMGLALMGGLFVGGLVLSLDRRQALYARILRRRRRER